MELDNQKADSLEVYVELEQAKNQTWEKNRAIIVRSIGILMRSNLRVPTKTEIAKETGLSRQTIHEHMKHLGHDPLLAEQLELFKLSASNVLAGIYHAAMDGDMRASRLALEVMGVIRSAKGNNNPAENQSNDKS